MFSKIQRWFIAAMMLVSPVLAWSQDAAPAAEATAKAVRYSPYTDPVFYALCMVVVVLLIFILQLQRVFSSVAKSFGKGGKYLSLLLIIASSFLLPETSFAADAATATKVAEEQVPFLHHGFGSNAMNALFVLIIFELIVVVYYVRLIRLFVVKEEEEVYSPEAIKAKPSFWEKFNQSVAIEKEEAILTDHNYDGIHELDNALPPWWKYGFYFTIVWAFGYIIYYHVTKSAPLQLGEYQDQLTLAETQMAEYRAKSANLVDETNVKLLAGDALGKGKATFESLCVTCHGASGEGKVGPNLTDAYWKHGGDIKDLFKVVKYGVSGTGMKSWKSELSPSQIAEVTSYILSLQGTNPANAKAPEGDLYTPTAAGDSTATATPDSTATAAVKDSIK